MPDQRREVGVGDRRRGSEIGRFTQSARVHATPALNWATHRVTLAKGTQVKITHAVAVKTVAYTKKDPLLGTPYPETMMPKYMESSKAGDRELYPHHYSGAGHLSDPNAPDTAKDPLTTGGARRWAAST